jgi:hypothetical protein
MTADALSDVLTVRLTGATFFDVVAKAPWVAESIPREMLLPKILPGAERLIAYHVLTEGRCFANIIGEEPITVEAGEVIVFTRGGPHGCAEFMKGLAFGASIADCSLTCLETIARFTPRRAP